METQKQKPKPVNFVRLPFLKKPKFAPNAAENMVVRQNG